MRLEQSEHRIRVARREFAPQPGLGRHVDRRQPLGRVIAALFAPRRRDRARNADRRRGVALERAGLGVQRAKQRHHPHRERPQRDLRRRRRRRGQDRAAGQRGAEGSARLEARRHAAPASRPARQGHRAAGLRHRRAAARHAVCRGHSLPGVRRRAAIGRRNFDRGNERRAPHRADAGRGGGGGRILVAGQARVGSAAHRVGRPRQSQPVERDDRESGARGT